jgi:hypothetical protein
MLSRCAAAPMPATPAATGAIAEVPPDPLGTTPLDWFDGGVTVDDPRPPPLCAAC